MKKNNIIYNKNIFYNYKILEKFTAGIILKGWEVKSIKNRNINIEKSYIKIKNKNELYLIGINIKLIKNNIILKNNEKKERKIKILLKKKEIQYLYNKNKKKGYTIVLISIIIKKPWFKLIIGLAKGKKKYNKKKKILYKKWNKKYNIDFNLKK